MDMSKRHASHSYSMSNLIAGLALIFGSAALVSSKPPTTLERILADGELRVLSRNGPTTYYEGPHGPTGFEYTLLQGFAHELGVTLVIKDEEKLGTILRRVNLGDAHLAAAGLTITERRSQLVDFNTPYMEVSQQLLYNSRERRPTGVEDLVGKNLLVIANSSHAERLRELQQVYPELQWQERNSLEMIDLLEMVHRGEVDYAVVDSNAYRLNQHTFPRAQVAFEIGEPQQLAWAFPKSRDQSLYLAAQAYLDRVTTDGTLTSIKEHFYDHIDEVTTGGALLFSYRLENRLPRWEEELKTAAGEFELDWQLLAALSYQESHWNPDARSRTGVRGLMMLTLAAASDMGISNRIDPSQSIYGGAKYFRSMYNRVSSSVTGEDRTWMAMAAYNVGLGHLEDARTLTKQHGDNPDKWADVSKYLPLLARRQYYRETRYGYARGWEPVTYVRNIRNFYNIIAWHSQQEQRRTALSANDAESENTSQRKVSHNTISASMSVL
jgi:membrane-bound lytic murein transglycosylase F